MAPFPPKFSPEIQIAFALRLEQIERQLLGDALSAAVGGLQITDIDRE